jgi:hypothetical protein
LLWTLFPALQPLLLDNIQSQLEVQQDLAMHTDRTAYLCSAWYSRKIYAGYQKTWDNPLLAKHQET